MASSGAKWLSLVLRSGSHDFLRTETTNKNNTMNTSAILRSLQEQLGKPVPVFGGIMVLNSFTHHDSGPLNCHALECQFQIASFIDTPPPAKAISDGATALEPGVSTLALTFNATEVKRKKKGIIPTAAVPQTVAQCIVIDRQGKVLVMHRSDKVRSAPNVWSFPSGGQEFGEPIDDTAFRELNEEYGLSGVAKEFVGVYENVPGDGYHWVIFTFVVLVDDVTKAVNNEPDRHDKMEFVPADQIYVSVKDFVEAYPFHESFQVFLMGNHDRVFDAMRRLSTATSPEEKL
jgi:8-oxo-dGTP pyrophosphatase MutT (NUDIX family)